VEINKEVGEREELLDIYMYGTPYNDTRPMYTWCEPIHHPNEAASCKSDFMLDNSVDLYGGVYAPNSSIQAHNSTKIWPRPTARPSAGAGPSAGRCPPCRRIPSPAASGATLVGGLESRGRPWTRRRLRR
jgi:hypothetical protein